MLRWLKVEGDCEKAPHFCTIDFSKVFWVCFGLLFSSLFLLPLLCFNVFSSVGVFTTVCLDFLICHSSVLSLFVWKFLRSFWWIVWGMGSILRWHSG